MYGIDQTLEQTADAYRGNPQMLQQKYAQNQNLIDLLALQKLKSEKESAQREMQLKMGGKPPTVADQREQQVLDMTKQEVVQEQAGVMQNKMREQQEAQKRLMQAAGAPQGMIGAAPQPQAGGIMNAMPQRLPSAGISGAAAPNMQRMAGGGIVAFDEGGNVDPLAAATGMSQEDLARDRERYERIKAREEAEKDALLQNFLRQAGAPQARRTSAETDSQYVAQDTQEGRGTPTAAPAAAAAPTPQGGMPTGGAPGTVGFGIRSLIGDKTPEQAARENEARAAAAANFSPEERAAKERQIQERTAFDRDSELTNFLLGMAGRSTPGLAIAAGGAAAQNTRNQAMLNRQRAEGELIDIGPASRIAGTKAGESRFKDVAAGMAQGVDAAVRQAQIASSAADRAMQQNTLDASRASQLQAILFGKLRDGEKDVNTLAENAKKSLFIMPGQKLNNEQQRALELIETQRQIGLEEVRNRIGPALAQAEQRMGVPSTGGFSLVGVRPNTPPK